MWFHFPFEIFSLNVCPHVPHLIVPKWSSLVVFNVTALIHRSSMSHSWQTRHGSVSTVPSIHAICAWLDLQPPQCKVQMLLVSEIHSWLLVLAQNDWHHPSYIFTNCYPIPNPYAREQTLFLTNGRSIHTPLVRELRANLDVTSVISSRSGKMCSCFLFPSFSL